MYSLPMCQTCRLLWKAQYKQEDWLNSEIENTEEVTMSQRGSSKEKFNTNYKLRNLWSSHIYGNIVKQEDWLNSKMKNTEEVKKSKEEQVRKSLTRITN